MKRLVWIISLGISGLLVAIIVYMSPIELSATLEKAIVGKEFDTNLDGRMSAIELGKIKRLDLDSCYIKDLEGISKVVNLETLYLTINPLDNVLEISKLKHLRILDLDMIILHKSQQIDVFDFYRSEGLNELHLSLNRIHNLSQIKVGNNLKKLWLSGNALTSLDGIEKYTLLETLYLDSNQIIDISPIENLTQLKTVDLRGNPIRN